MTDNQAQHSVQSGIIRPATPDDIPALKAPIDAVDLFPSAMLDNMMADYFNQADGDHLWLTDDDGPVGVLPTMRLQ